MAARPFPYRTDLNPEEQRAVINELSRVTFLLNSARLLIEEQEAKDHAERVVASVRELLQDIRVKP